MTGSISISATNSFGEIIVGDVLSRFQEKYPERLIPIAPVPQYFDDRGGAAC
jgi:DNA-binding transcriptional LysR family regulator